MAWETDARKGLCLVSIRWLMTWIFLISALVRLTYLNHAGLELYYEIVVQAGLPVWFQFYGVAAIVVELTLVVGLWIQSLYKTACVAMVVHSGLGAGISVYSLLLKLVSDCGCGFLGGHEVWLLIQKAVSIAVFITLYKSEQWVYK